MIEESYVSFDTAKMLKEAGFDVPTSTHYSNSGEVWQSSAPEDYNDDKSCKACSRPTQALAARWLREKHDIDVMIDVYNRDYYCCNIYKNKHLMIIKNIVSSDYVEVLESGLQEAIKLIKKKIMFNDKFGLTQAVIDGRKTQTRRIIKVQPSYKNLDIAFPVFVEDDWPPKNPLYGTFCWVNKDNPEEYTDWIRPLFKDGEVVAIAQSMCDVYAEWDMIHSGKDTKALMKKFGGSPCFNNKMFVKASEMPHQIRITNVRLQKLQDISDDDCLKEGIIHAYTMEDGTKIYHTPHVNGDYDLSTDDVKEAFAHLINKVSRNGVLGKKEW